MSDTYPPEPPAGDTLGPDEEHSSSQSGPAAPSRTEEVVQTEPRGGSATEADPRVEYYRLQRCVVKGQVELERIVRRAAARDSFLALLGTLLVSLTALIGGIVLVGLGRNAAGMLAIGGGLALLLAVFLVYRPARPSGAPIQLSDGREGTLPTDATQGPA